jgi:phosphoribosyl 1,2-cyclic phosphate phosphodiesterase
MAGRREFVILGCGTSVGVPMIGCDCRVCTSPDPKNHRTRASALIRLPAGNVVIDTGPEFRLQLVREKVPLVHAVLYTHYHADHLFGLDDARQFPRKLNGPLPLYCTDETEEVVRQVFGYAFHPQAADLPAGVLPKLQFHRIRPAEPFEVLGQTVTPIPFQHSRFNVLGFRIGDVAYCTDVSHVPDASWPRLEGLDVLVIDALKPGHPHPAHLSVEQAVAVAERVRPRRTILTHMSHEIEYDAARRTLPAGVEPAYDGLRFDF